MNLPYVKVLVKNYGAYSDLCKIRSIQNRYKIRSTFYTEITLRKLLCKPKGRIATEDKSNSVYEIDWNNCKEVCFGESKQFFETLLRWTKKLCQEVWLWKQWNCEGMSGNRSRLYLGSVKSCW